MNIFILIVHTLFTIGLWIYIIWIGRMISNLHKMTNSTKNIFDSMKSYSQFMQNAHDTVRKLYDPKEIEKLVEIKLNVQKEQIQKHFETIKATDVAKASEKAKEVLKGIINPTLQFIAGITFYCSEDQVNEVLKRLDDTEFSRDIKEFIEITQKEIKKFDKKRQKECNSSFSKSQLNFRVPVGSPNVQNSPKEDKIGI